MSRPISDKLVTEMTMWARLSYGLLWYFLPYYLVFDGCAQIHRGA